jgi:hypothetical protein
MKKSFGGIYHGKRNHPVRAEDFDSTNRTLFMAESAMGIIKDQAEASQTTNQAITKVLMAQCALVHRHWHPNLMKYIERPTWRKTASALTAHYWPRTVAEELHIQAEIERLYSVYLVLAPLAGQAQAFWMPWRHNGHLTSWFRMYVYGQKKSHLMVRDWDWESGIDGLFESAEAYGIKDKLFIDLCHDLITGNVFAPTLRGQFARKIFAPLLFHQQAKEMLDLVKTKRSLLWWDEKHVLVLSGKPVKGIEGTWCDLGKESRTIWNYSVKVKGDDLMMYMSDEYLRNIRSNIVGIMDSFVPPQTKIYRISEIMRGTHRWAKHCFQAKIQCNELEKWVWNKINKSILQQNRSLDALYFNIRNAAWDNTLYKRGKSQLLEGLSIESWLKWWSPRR